MKAEYGKIPNLATFVIMIIPSFGYGRYNEQCLFKHAIFIYWLNWYFGLKWGEYKE